MKTGFSKRKALFLFILSCFLLLFFNSQSVQITAWDKEYLIRFQHDWHLNPSEAEVHKDFNSELNFVSLMQDSVVAEIKQEEIPHQFFGDISFYYNNHEGFCYDRAVLMEKLLSLYNFSFRHVYIYFGKNGQNATLKDFFEKSTASHAAIEVKTKKGWMAVGTNANWLGLTSGGEVITFGELRKRIHSNKLDLKKPVSEGQAFWTGKGSNYCFIYGVYSRHGDFFSHTRQNLSTSSMQPQFHVFPDYNMKMLLYNFTD